MKSAGQFIDEQLDKLQAETSARIAEIDATMTRVGATQDGGQKIIEDAQAQLDALADERLQLTNLLTEVDDEKAARKGK